MRFKLIKDWSISTKIFALTIIVLLPFLYIYFFQILPSIKTKLLEDKKDTVRSAVEVAYGILIDQNEHYKTGDYSLEEAQEMAEELIQDLRYDNGEYFWLNTYDMQMVMHPIKPELNGTDISGLKDPTGLFFLKEMTKTVNTKGEGFQEYMWPKPGFDKPVAKVSYVKGFEDWKWLVGSGIYINDVEDELAAFQLQFFILLGGAGFIVVLLGFFMARKISKPIKDLETAASDVSNGNVDVSVDIKGDDEIGKLAVSFNKMVGNIRRSMNEIKVKGEEAEKAAAEAHQAQLLAQKQQTYLEVNTEKILSEMNKFSEGDLTVHIDSELKDDAIGRLFNGFNKAVNNIKEMIYKVTEAVQATASASTQISSSSEEMAAGAQEQSAQASEVAVSVEEMSRTVSEMARNASSAFDSSNQSSLQAKQGTETVLKSKEGFKKIIETSERTSTIVASLAGKTNQIGEIIQVIDEIADQTNLLALNAAIEAARAGEEGRGFAVVADEVRKLAERTTKATKEIAATIKSIQSEADEANNSMTATKTVVDEGQKLNDEVESALNNIKGSADDVNRQINQLAASSEQQSSTSEQISRSIESISSVTQQSAAGVQQIARAAEDLNRLTENLQNLITRFKVDRRKDSDVSDEVYESTGDIYNGGNGYH